MVKSLASQQTNPLQPRSLGRKISCDIKHTSKGQADYGCHPADHSPGA